MLFRDIPIGAKFTFCGRALTKLNHTGRVKDSEGKEDWIASHNEVEIVVEKKPEPKHS